MPSAERWRGKRVLITGVCGTVGAELLRQLARTQAAEIIGVDNNESAVFFLQQDWRLDDRIQLFLGDVRDSDTLRKRTGRIDIIVHAAALKHVHLCEHSPRDAVRTNILGVQNVIDAALTNEVERVVFTSSDKAVNPTTVMGTSKLMGERLMTAAGQWRDTGTIFASTRFGNVLGSRGSVIPLFKRQILAGGPLTLTDTRMTRFIMSLSEAVRLVMDSVFLAHGGEVYVTKMPALRIPDLAQVMIEELVGRGTTRARGIEILEVGPRAGEKLYEELLNEEETRRTVEIDDFYVVLPATAQYRDFEHVASVGHVQCPYTSEHQPPMTVEQVRSFLRDHSLLHESVGGAVEAGSLVEAPLASDLGAMSD